MERLMMNQDEKLKLFASIETYVVEVYEGDSFLFELKATNEVKISVGKGTSSVQLEEALLDSDVWTNAMKGLYHNKNLTLKLKSIWRNQQNHKDYDVEVEIKNAVLREYLVKAFAGKPSSVKVAFSYFADKDGVDVNIYEREDKEKVVEDKAFEEKVMSVLEKNMAELMGKINQQMVDEVIKEIRGIARTPRQ